MSRKRLTSAALMTAGLAATTEPAFAYLDPGSGSVMLQVILGGLAGIAVGAKLFWQYIVAFFTFGRRGKGGEE